MTTTRFSNGLIIAAVCLLVASTGCRNRVPYCQPGCYPNAAVGGPINGVIGQTTVPSPSTYSINIPGQNQPYYNANATAQVPTPTTGSLPQNNPTGWRPVGSATAPTGTLSSPPTTAPTTAPLGGSTTRNQTPATSQSRLTSVIDRPNQNQLANNRANGLSYTNDSNFRSTVIDERLDRSRLPVTDASLVRAPTTFTPQTTIGQFNNPLLNQTAYNQTAYNQPVYNQAPRIAQAPAYYSQPVAYSAQPAPNVVVGSFTQPTFAQPPQQTYRGLSTQNPTVLAQNTVFADPANNPNYQNGWRDRELTAGRDSLSR